MFCFHQKLNQLEEGDGEIRIPLLLPSQQRTSRWIKVYVFVNDYIGDDYKGRISIF